MGGGGIIYQIFTSSSLVSLGLYHLISTTRNHLKFPRDYSAKPYHPFSSSSTSTSFFQRLSRHLPLYLLISCLLISLIHQTLISTLSDPLLQGSTPVYRFTSLQSAAVLLLFLILSLSLLFSDSILPSFPPDLFFALASALFFLQYSVSSSSASLQISALEAKCDSISARISALSSFLCLLLACLPRLFVADLALGGSLFLQGLWALQTGLSLHVDAFIPEGCHKLLDVASGIEGSTKCEPDESKLRAAALLDLVFVLHVLFLFLVIIITYAALAKTLGTTRRFGSYEALPTAAAATADTNHIQMKSITGTQA